MRRKQRFERLYMKYIVKSSGLFGIYLGAFISVFMIVSSRVTLEERRAYEAEIDGSEIEIVCEEGPAPIGDRVYFYRDKNQEVFSSDVKEVEYRDGVMYIFLAGEQKGVSGKVTVEIVSGKNTLFQKIFMKAGTA